MTVLFDCHPYMKLVFGPKGGTIGLKFPYLSRTLIFKPSKLCIHFVSSQEYSILEINQ